MTIYDIAEHCGVSIATVSRVLNGSDKVSPKTKKKILAAMNEMEYTPNPFARGLGLDSMKMVGILCTDIADTFYARAVALVERGLKEKGINVILGCTGEKIQEKIRYTQIMTQQRVDAMLLIGSSYNFTPNNPECEYLREAASKMPIVTVNSRIELDNVYSVVCDEISGIRDCTNLLIDQGHENILYLYDKLNASGQQKLQGYESALKNHGLKQNQRQLTIAHKRDMHSAQSAVRELLQDKYEFTAILASEDILAVGAQKALAEAGLSMPVIGCNNSILAQCATPALTSLDNRLDVLCPAAVEILEKIVLNGNTAILPTVTMFPPVLVERDSFRYTK